jgi:hypothetical protein
MDYAQIARQMRLQLLGIGALTVLHAAPASLPEQSNEPSPGAGNTHDGGGGDCKQLPAASEYFVPPRHGPASGSLATTHP